MSSQEGAAPRSAETNASNHQPQRYCDIVMKGGITSGIVYPSAVYELSKTYQFKNVGGTSAGAIAAAATAAAQYGANHAQGEGFEGVADLPNWLSATAPGGKDSNLLHLFQPQPATKSLFRVIIAGIGNKRGKFFRLTFAIIRSFPVALILGVVPGLLIGFLTARAATGLAFYLNLFSALVLICGGLILSLGFVLYRKITQAIPQNYYGICSGFGEAQPGEAEALTPWLSKLVNRLAGKAENGPPLTFGDLWGPNLEAHREINLQMLTTSLSHGRPYRLPFEENIFYFDPQEFRKFFPEEVVSWMEQNPRKTDDADKYSPLRPLPAAANLPIVVATRLSLSFPILLSAVPLYAIDFSRKNPEDRKPERCWFSDGGICSNFPVHFFDNALPRWPTFAINLRPFHIDYPNDAVWMPSDNGSGRIEWWTRFAGKSGIASLAGFFGAIKNTMQNWMDNTQTRLPGYRDRIAQISLNDKKEGGLNLNMPPPLIQDLGGRGRLAAQKLVDNFTSVDPDLELSWDNHRWVRFRSTMSLLDDLLNELSFALNNPLLDDRSYVELISRPKYDPVIKNLEGLPKSYPWQEPGQQAFATEAIRELMELLTKWQELKIRDEQNSFGGEVPKPGPELRIRPRI